MSKIAKKSNPSLWEKVKIEAKRKLGGHSARSMQLATKLYKQRGGKYIGKKSSKNSMKKWTKEKWDYINPKDKDKPKSKKGRYLPKLVRESLTTKQRSYENTKKRSATKSGKFKGKYSKQLIKKLKEKQVI